jgi:hypothetical protein
MSTTGAFIISALSGCAGGCSIPLMNLNGFHPVFSGCEPPNFHFFKNYAENYYPFVQTMEEKERELQGGKG